MQGRPDLEAIGQLVPGAEELEFLAEGGYKAVYKIRLGGTTQALKLIFVPSEANYPDEHAEILARVKREVDSLSVCDCPYLVKLGSLAPRTCELAGLTYVLYSEELLKGESLRGQIRSGRRPSPEECRTLMRCLVEVIQELKARGLIHRDIKPDNVIATGDTVRPYVVLDLGIAYKLDSTPITRNPEARQGTLPYMAPEMFLPRFHDVVDHRSDLYSAGVTVYEYASGAHPIARRGEDDYSTALRIARMVPIPLEKHRPDLPIPFCHLVDQLLKKNPALRPSQLDALRQALEPTR